MLRILYPQEVSENEQLNLLLPREETERNDPPWALAPAATTVTPLVPSVLSGCRKRKVSQQPWSSSAGPPPDPALDSAPQRCTRPSGTLGGTRC